MDFVDDRADAPLQGEHRMTVMISYSRNDRSLVEPVVAFLLARKFQFTLNSASMVRTKSTLAPSGSRARPCRR